MLYWRWFSRRTANIMTTGKMDALIRGECLSCHIYLHPWPLFFCLIKRAKIDVLFERGFHKKVINSAFRIPFKLTCMLILRYWKYIQNKGLRRKENSSFTILFTLSLDRFMILCYAVNLKVLLLSINNKWQRTFQKHVAIFQATQTWETWSDCPEIISKKIELLKVAVALILHSLT